MDLANSKVILVRTAQSVFCQTWHERVDLGKELEQPLNSQYSYYTETNEWEEEDEAREEVTVE